MPSLIACWRNAPMVRFIAFEILETGVFDLEWPRKVCGRLLSKNAFLHDEMFLPF
jgi:hypothetical protein